MSEAETSASFEGWAILELMGHRRLAGYVRDVEAFGGRFCRIDIPEANEQPAATQLYGAASVYCLTPTTEVVARAVAAGSRLAPVNRWELSAALPARSVEDEVEDDLDERDESFAF